MRAILLGTRLAADAKLCERHNLEPGLADGLGACLAPTVFAFLQAMECFVDFEDGVLLRAQQVECEITVEIVGPVVSRQVVATFIE